MKRPLFAGVAAIIVGAATVVPFVLVRHESSPPSAKARGISSSASQAHIASLPPVTDTALLSAPVPASCNHSAGTLANGRLPGIPQFSGYMQLGWLDDPSSQGSRLALGDLNGDGRADAAAVLDCDTGGDARPQIVAFYSAGPKLLGSVNLSTVNLPGHAPGLATVNKMSFRNGAIDVRWATQQEDDAAATPTLAYSATLRWNGRSIVSSNLTATTEVNRTVEFLADLRRGDTSAAAALAAPGVVAKAANQFRLYPNALKSSPECHGLLYPNVPDKVEALVDFGTSSGVPNIDRICLLPTAANGANYVVLGMRNTGFRRWQVAWVRVV